MVRGKAYATWNSLCTLLRSTEPPSQTELLRGELGNTPQIDVPAQQQAAISVSFNK